MNKANFSRSYRVEPEGLPSFTVDEYSMTLDSLGDIYRSIGELGEIALTEEEIELFLVGHEEEFVSGTLKSRDLYFLCRDNAKLFVVTTHYEEGGFYRGLWPLDHDPGFSCCLNPGVAVKKTI